ncbi:MAG: hypothetical protein AAFY29_10960 [Pseudomonadota bacterium]
MSEDNQIVRLRRILGERPTRVGTSLGPNGDGTSNVDMLDGGTIRAVGSAGLGQAVFVKDGQIVGNAPTPSLVVIDV